MAQFQLAPEEEQGRIQVPIVEEKTPESIHQRGVSSVLVAVDQGRDPVASYLESIQSSESDWIKRTESDRLGAIQSQLPYSSPETIQKEITDLSTNLSGGVNGGNYVEAIKTMPSSIGKTEEEIATEALHMEMRETVTDNSFNWREMGAGEITSNIGGVLIPKRKAAAMVKLMTDMGFIDNIIEKADVFIDPTEEIVKLRSVFINADDNGKRAFIKMFAEHLPNSSENDIIKSEIVNNIFGDFFSTGDSSFFEFIDLTDVGLAAKALYNIGKGFGKSVKIINTGRRLKEPDLVAELIEEAVKNPEAAAKSGVTQADVGDVLNPLLHGEPGTLLTGAPSDMAASIKHMMDIQDAQFRAITDFTERHGILDREGIEDAMAAAQLEQLRQPGVVEATVTVFDETGFKVSWKEVHMDTLGRVRLKSKENIVDFKVNDIGDLRAPVDEWVDSGVTTLDPNARMTGSLRHWYVSTVEKMARTQERTADAFDQMLRASFKDLDTNWTFFGKTAKRSAMVVNDALMKGSKTGKTFNYDELVTGVTGTKLSPKEAKAYIGVRNVVEKLYQLKNKQIVDNYLANGVKVFDGPQGTMAIKSYATSKAASTAWGQAFSDSLHILVPEGRLKIKGLDLEDGLIPLKRKGQLTKEMIQDAYEKGYVLARNHTESAFFKKGEVKTQWAFVKDNKVHSPRGKTLLNRIEGYMPKQRTGAYYFIKKNKDAGLSGAKKGFKVKSTQAYSDTLEAANRWKNAQKNPDLYEVVFDRELTSDQRLHEVASTAGGMYSKGRKSEELAYVGSGDATFANSFEALQHYINHIGRQYPASLYRLGSEARLLAMAKDLGITGRGLGLHNLLQRASEKFPITDRNYKMLKGIHDQISFVNMIPTDEELAMANRWRVWGAALDKPFLNKIPGWENVPKIFYERAAKNLQPVDLIRGITFNHLLGMYNPAQIVVQWSGSLVSFAIDPINFAKHTSQAFGWTALDNLVSDPLAQKKMLDWMRSNGLKEFTDEYELWTRSGFRESVVQGNADYTSVFTKNLPYDAGILRKVMANHTLFYKMGELVNTRTAFATSITRYKKVHNVSSINPKNEAALEEVGLWAEKFRLNMSRANQSSMNRGLKAIPLQFQQVISKYYEKVLPQMMGGTDEFTSWEKARLFAIPTMATGSVGIPMGQWVTSKILGMYGVDPSELSEDEATLAKYGVIAWMNSDMLDLNTNISERMTLSGDIVRNMWEGLTTSKSTWEWMGASGTVIDRYARNMQYLTNAFDLTLFENEQVTTDELMAIPAIIAEALSDIPSVTRNMKQYYSHLFTDNPAFIRDGKYLWDFEDMNFQTAFFGAAGFAPREMSEMYELNKHIKDSAGGYSTFGDTDSDIILRILNTKLLNGESIQASKLYTKTINSILRKYSPGESQDLLTQIFEKANKKKFDQDNLVYQHYLRTEVKYQEGMDFLSTLVSRKNDERKTEELK